MVCKLERFAYLARALVLMCFRSDNLACESTKPSKNGRPILFGIENFAGKVCWF